MTVSYSVSSTSEAPGWPASTFMPSMAGTVFGMMSTFVYPPDAAAAQPEIMDSL